MRSITCGYGGDHRPDAPAPLFRAVEYAVRLRPPDQVVSSGRCVLAGRLELAPAAAATRQRRGSRLDPALVGHGVECGYIDTPGYFYLGDPPGAPAPPASRRDGLSGSAC